jgi:hypothetical protein
LRASASHSASRVFARDHTAAKPEALVSRAVDWVFGSRPAGTRPAITSLKRIGSADGSSVATLPKKLFSCVVDKPVCESVEPIKPNLNGLTPSDCS